MSGENKEESKKSQRNFERIKKLVESSQGTEIITHDDKILSEICFFIDYVFKEQDLLDLIDSTRFRSVMSNSTLWTSKTDGIDERTLLSLLKYNDIPLINDDDESSKQLVTKSCSSDGIFLKQKIFQRLYEIEKKKNEHLNNLVLKSQEYAKSYSGKSIICFILAFLWFLLCWFVPYQLFQYNYFGEIFIFLSNLLFKLPSFVLCLVGVKFLYLFVNYKTEERELSMLDSYLEKLTSDSTKEKAELVKQLAPHFFPDKKATKISQGFSQELLRKAMEK